MAAAAPFTGLRVLDLSHGIAGAYAGKLLCDQGACVLKVEEPRAPDPLRAQVATAQATLGDGEDGALFRFLNAGKRAALCNSASAQDRAQLETLLLRAHIVIENDAHDELARRVGQSASAREQNPQLCIVSISPWGRRGPWAARPANEWTLQAATGFMARRGTPARGPVGAGGRIGEYAAGAFAAVLALAAWRLARASGRGRRLDISLFEAMLICTTQYWDLNAQFLGGTLKQYVDTPSIEPCADGWVGFATTTAQQWQDFCLMIERPELARDPSLRDANARMARLEFVRAAIHAWTRPRTSAEILERCELLRIPCAPVLGGGALLRADHFRARGVFVKNPHGFLQPRVPFQLTGVPRTKIRRAPSLGEHNLTWPDDGDGDDGDTTRTKKSARTDGDRHHATKTTHTTNPTQTISQLARQASASADAGQQLEALHGLRVVDLTAFWAGPFATAVMALLGADVIKVESTKRPDGMRFVNAHPDAPPWEGGSIFHGANTDKRGITLQLDHDEGRALLRRLLARADVLIENFSVRVLGHFGLSWPALQRAHPRLILLRMPAWGLDGPWCGRTGFAMNVEQASGLALRAGYADQPLVAGLCDPLGSLHAVTALFAALETRAKTGRGLMVEAPLVETALNVAAEPIVEYCAYEMPRASELDSATGTASAMGAADSASVVSATTDAAGSAGATAVVTSAADSASAVAAVAGAADSAGVAVTGGGARAADCAPQGIYACAGEGWLALAVESDTQWRALTGVLADADETFTRARGVFDDAAFARAAVRHARCGELDRALAGACAGHDAPALAARLRAVGVPAEALVNGHRVMPNPQLEARGFYKTLKHHFTGTARYPGLPCTGLADARPRRAPPTLGQHNREILGAELGLSDAALEALRQKSVIGERPHWEK